MRAADPTYPLYPLASLSSALLLLLVLLTGFVRQSWNLGVAFLCFWLFWEILAEGINAIIWSDNADIKLYVYCDIGEWTQRYWRPVIDVCSIFKHVSFAPLDDCVDRQTYGDVNHIAPAISDRPSAVCRTLQPSYGAIQDTEGHAFFELRAIPETQRTGNRMDSWLCHSSRGCRTPL